MKNTESRLNEMETRIESLELRTKLIRHYCPTCKRETLTTSALSKQKITDETTNKTDLLLFYNDPTHSFSRYSKVFTCEICGTQYKLVNEEKIVIIEPKKEEK